MKQGNVVSASTGAHPGSGDFLEPVGVDITEGRGEWWEELQSSLLATAQACVLWGPAIGPYVSDTAPDRKPLLLLSVLAWLPRSCDAGSFALEHPLQCWGWLPNVRLFFISAEELETSLLCPG